METISCLDTFNQKTTLFAAILLEKHLSLFGFVAVNVAVCVASLLTIREIQVNSGELWYFLVSILAVA